MCLLHDHECVHVRGHAASAGVQVSLLPPHASNCRDKNKASVPRGEDLIGEKSEKKGAREVDRLTDGGGDERGSCEESMR